MLARVPHSLRHELHEARTDRDPRLGYTEFRRLSPPEWPSSMPRRGEVSHPGSPCVPFVLNGLNSFISFRFVQVRFVAFKSIRQTPPPQTQKRTTKFDRRAGRAQVSCGVANDARGGRG